MNREILVNVNADETRVALVEGGSVVEFYLERPTTHKTVGNIYLGKVTNVLPGMQAAFVDIGEDKNAFLYVDDASLPPELQVGRDPKPAARRKRAINDLVKPGQSILVQVTKEAMGTKGSRVTRHVTLPGRYLVLMPTVNYVGVSKRIADEEERQRLRQLAKDVKSENMGVIIRTVAENKSREEIERDLNFGIRLWEKIQAEAKLKQAPALIHEDLDLVARMVRDELNEKTAKMIIDDGPTYGRVLDLLDAVSPEMKDRVVYYREKDIPLFSLYGVDAAIEQALQRQVRLKSGGYIVVDRTEALTVIDVNTGRYVGTKNLSDTVLKTNLEACDEICRQLRLRDIGGIIVIDFIDMDNPEDKAMVLSELEQHLKKDHTKTVVVGLTGLGLVEMTRKKARQSLDAMLTKMCPYCRGKGTVMSEEAVASKIRREIRTLLGNTSCEAVLVEVSPGVASYLIGPGGSNLKDLEKETGKSIFIRGSEDLHIEDMNVKALGTKEEIAVRAAPVKVGDVLDLVIEEPHHQNDSDGIARIEGYVIQVEGASSKVGEKVRVEITSSLRTFAKAVMIDED